MDLPRLDTDTWPTTRTSLHRAAQVLGAVRKAMIAPLPNALHLSLYVTPNGLTTGKLNDDTALALDFKERTVKRLDSIDGNILNTWHLADHTQTSLTAALANTYQVEFFAEGDEVLTVDEKIGAEYAVYLYRIYTAFARFRARLYGTMTPLVVWTHHFDLSFVWFTGHVPDEHHQPHINFGFAPFSDGIDLPYIYAYGWSPDGGYTIIDPKPPIKFQTEGFTGAMIDYTTLKSWGNPEAMIERSLMDLYERFGTQ